MGFANTAILLALFLKLLLIRADDDVQRHNLIILLIDGYGADLYNRTSSSLKDASSELIKNGVRADMKPVFPTQSYPNWNSLLTGLYVENHNFTADFMYDNDRHVFFQRDQGANDSDYHWWTGGPDPLYYTVGRSGIDVHCHVFASCHRPHVDMLIKVPENRQHSFNKKESYDLFSHIPKIMRHIKRYQQYRQQLVLLNYGDLAGALRLYGENQDGGKQALSSADAQIRKIQDSMTEHDLFSTTNLLVLSSFGLKEVSSDQQYFIDECFADTSKVKRVVNSLAFMFVYPEEGQEDTVYFELRVCDQWAAETSDYDENEVPLVSVYRKSEIPERYHWKGARFIAPIVLIARPGATLMTTQIPSTEVSEAQGRELQMLSGWDNEAPEMQGMFLARGPAFKQDYISTPIEIVDVYELSLKLLGLSAKNPHNGTWDNVAEMLSSNWEQPEESDFSSQNCLASLILAFCLLLNRLL